MDNRFKKNRILERMFNLNGKNQGCNYIEKNTLTSDNSNIATEIIVYILLNCRKKLKKKKA